MTEAKSPVCETGKRLRRRFQEALKATIFPDSLGSGSRAIVSSSGIGGTAAKGDVFKNPAMQIGVQPVTPVQQSIAYRREVFKNSAMQIRVQPMTASP